MDAYLDDAIGDNSKLLVDLLRSLKKEEKILCGQLGGGDTSKVNEWQDVVAEVQSTLAQLRSLQQQLVEVEQETTMMREHTGAGDDSKDWKRVQCCVEEIKGMVKQVSELEKLDSYLTWLRHIQQLSCQIEADVDTSPGVKAVQAFKKLNAACETLTTSSCQQLKAWASDTQQYWMHRLCRNLSRWFVSVLEQVEWPLTSSSTSLQLVNKWEDNMQLFSQLFLSLLHLDQLTQTITPAPAPREPPATPTCPVQSVAPPAVSTSSSSSSQLASSPLPLPMELMVEPLRKRFRYHFMETKRTNNLEKPEWYLTQVSSWLRDHTPILDQRVQPILDQCQTNHYISAKHEFGRGLLQEVISKLEADLPAVVQDDALMAHLLDELLLFDHELRLMFPGTTHSCPLTSDTSDTSSTLTTPGHVLSNDAGGGGEVGVVSSGGSGESVSTYSVLPVLLQEVPFDKWRNLEKSYAIERLREFTSSPEAWSLAYESIVEADLSRVPQCTEQLMTLIKEITEHYRYIPSRHHQLLFLELQVDLLLEFHCDLDAAVSKTHPLHSRFPTYLNASHYIYSVLLMWAQEQLFIDLWKWSNMKSSTEGTQGGAEFNLSSPTTPSEHGQDNILDGGNRAGEEGSVFDVALSAFKSLREEMGRSLVEHILGVARTNTAKYKAEKWHGIKDHTLQLVMHVSPGAADLLTSLREHLSFVSENVSVLLSPALLEQLAQGMDSLLLNNVILVSSFNDGGVQQLNFDLQNYFIPVLAGFGDHLMRKTLYEKCVEAVRLLSLPRGSALLLLEVLDGAASDGSGVVIPRFGGVVLEEAVAAAVSALNDVQVHALSPLQSRRILQQRLYTDNGT